MTCGSMPLKAATPTAAGPTARGFVKGRSRSAPGAPRSPGTRCALSRDALPARFHLAHPRTLRRWVLMRDADLLVTPSHLLVVLAFTKRRAWLRPLLQRFNKGG